MRNFVLWPNGGTPRLGLETQTPLHYSAPRRGRATSSPPQFGQRCDISDPHAVQNVHSKLQITASPASARVVLHRSHTARISNMVLALLRPETINESLVFVEEPALAQLLILHSVQQHAADTPRRVTEVLDRNQCTERVADENILDSNQLP